MVLNTLAEMQCARSAKKERQKKKDRDNEHLSVILPTEAERIVAGVIMRWNRDLFLAIINTSLFLSASSNSLYK